KYKEGVLGGGFAVSRLILFSLREIRVRRGLIKIENIKIKKRRVESRLSGRYLSNSLGEGDKKLRPKG
ncbi:MAG: hypothetical protein ACUVV5_05730, partial [Candidatus Aminicenantales bacterium]